MRILTRQSQPEFTDPSAPDFPVQTDDPSLSCTAAELAELIKEFGSFYPGRFGSDDLCYVYREWNDKSNSYTIGAAFRLALSAGYVTRLQEQYQTLRPGGHGSWKNYYIRKGD